MFNIKKLFGFGNEVVESTVTEAVVEKPMKSDAAPEATVKGRKGRTLTAEAQTAHEAVAALLTETPQTRSALIGKLDASFQTYVNGNWQGLIARLITQGKAKLADGGQSRGRNVSYIRA